MPVCFVVVLWVWLLCCIPVAHQDQTENKMSGAHIDCTLAVAGNLASRSARDGEWRGVLLKRRDATRVARKKCAFSSDTAHCSKKATTLTTCALHSRVHPICIITELLPIQTTSQKTHHRCTMCNCDPTWHGETLDMGREVVGADAHRHKYVCHRLQCHRLNITFSMGCECRDGADEQVLAFVLCRKEKPSEAI